MTRALRHDCTINLGSETLAFTLLRVPRRKHVHLVVGDDARLEVRAPWRYSLASACSVLEEHRDWVLRRVRAARQRTLERPRLMSGESLPLLDEQLTLDVSSHAQLSLFASAEARASSNVRRRGGVLHVTGANLGAAELRALLEKWYQLEAKTLLPARLAKYADILELYPSKVTIRGQRTRWGSCSQRGAISLNWRLLLVPGELADYVLVHELCHLRHLDHSDAFWRLVGEVIPDHERRRARLRAVQSSLAL